MQVGVCFPQVDSFYVAISCNKPSLYRSTEGPGDMTGVPLLSANPRKISSVICLISSGISVQTRYVWRVWPPTVPNSVLPRPRLNGGKREIARRLQRSSENPFSNFQSLLFHSRQCWTGHILGPHRSAQSALLQHKVVVGSRVHGVENIGVVRDPKLYRNKKRDEENKCEVPASFVTAVRLILCVQPRDVRICTP